MEHPRIVIIAGLALATAAACGGEEPAQGERRPLGQQPSAGMEGELPEGHPEVPGMTDAAAPGSLQRELPPSVTVHLDSGNVAYRAGDYEAALRHFRAAVREDTTAAAGWFGVYMAERALGDEAAADSALRRAGGLGGAGGMHPSPEEEDTAGGATPDLTHEEGAG